MIEYPRYPADADKALLVFRRLPLSFPSAEGGEKNTYLPPETQEGGVTMMLTFISTWDIGDVLSAAQLIVTLIALIRADRKK